MSEWQVDTTKPVSKNSAGNTGRNLTVSSKPTETVGGIEILFMERSVRYRLKKIFQSSRSYMNVLSKPKFFWLVHVLLLLSSLLSSQFQKGSKKSNVSKINSHNYFGLDHIAPWSWWILEERKLVSSLACLMTLAEAIYWITVTCRQIGQV